MMEPTRWDDPEDLDVPFEGSERRVLAYNDTLMLVHNALDKDIEYPPHTHDETIQGIIVIEGEVEIFGDETHTLGTGDSIVIPPGIHHGIRGTAPHSRLFVAFTPPVDLSPADIEEE